MPEVVDQQNMISVIEISTTSIESHFSNDVVAAIVARQASQRQRYAYPFIHRLCSLKAPHHKQRSQDSSHAASQA